MITIDKTGINAEKRESPLWGGLEEFAHEVSMLKPLCNFKADDDCLKTEYSYKDETDEQGNTRSKQTRTVNIYKVKVFQDGEELGAISMSERYHQGNKEIVYGVHSFRINKERGDREATLTKNFKTALRTVKKVFVSRADDELRHLIKENVEQSMSMVWNQTRNAVTYSMDTSAEALGLAIHAYQARQRGESTYSVPAMPATVKRHKEHDRQCEEYVVSTFLNSQLNSKIGYGIKVFDNSSLAVLNFSDMSVTKYKAFEALPDDIQSKLAMFKVISINEPHAHLGCKFSEDMYYIVAGDLQLES